MNTAAFFAKHDYVVIPQLIDSEKAADLYRYTLNNLDHGNLTDDQVPGSPSFYQDETMQGLHRELQACIEQHLAISLLPTFNYYRTYRKGAILRAHKDRRACEIGISLNLGQQGDIWPFWLMDSNENAQAIKLAPGDAVIYRGPKLMHWRGQLQEADFVSQVFLFFVQSTAFGRLAKRAEGFKKLLKSARRFLKIKSY